MPWLETEPMAEKVKFIAAYLNNESYTFEQLCSRFNISRKTGYKYLKRYKEGGIDGLKEQSRAPYHQAKRMPGHIEESLLNLKSRRPTWGSKKIRSWLIQEREDMNWPAKSTIDDLFKRHGLVRPAKRKKTVVPYTQPFIGCCEPNDTWSIDYKGEFLMGNKRYCYPLTITDNYSRYLLGIRGSERISSEKVKEALKNLFLEYGLPLAIRSDNGSPFAGRGIAGLSTLAVWLIKLGIAPERIRKGHPEENGRHERMHLTLKLETASPPKQSLEEQQKSFDTFRLDFNEQRPHEAIEFKRPSWVYQHSPRTYPTKQIPVEYDSGCDLTRRVSPAGLFRWKGKEIFVSETLGSETIGMKPHSEYEWVLYYSFLPLGIFNEKTLKIAQL